MKREILLLFLLTVIASLALVSGFSVNTNSIILSQPLNSTQFTIQTTSNDLNVSFGIPAINGISFTISESSTHINLTRTFTLVPSSKDLTAFKLGSVYSGILNITNQDNASESHPINIQIIKDYCSNGEQTENLSITSISVKNQGSGDDADWKPLDEIEVKVRVSNPDSDNKISTVVKLGLYNSKGSEELDVDSVDLGKIGSSDKTATFTFIVPADLDEDTYFLYAKAYKDGNEKSVCTAKSGDFDNNGYYKTITVSKEDKEGRQIVFDKLIVDPSTATCGEEITVRANIVNVGTSDQDEVKTSIYNKALGVDLFVVSSNVNQGDKIPIEFTFTVPANAAEKVYQFDLSSMYDFNDDYQATDNSAYDQLGDSFTATLKVEGCTQTATSDADISASLQTSEADIKQGGEVVIKATITNTGDSTTTYIVDLQGQDTFSTLQSINPTSVTLNKGESKDVLITLKLNADSAGDHIFTIRTVFGSNQVTKQVSLSVPKSAGFNFSFLSNVGGNWLIWVIVLINVILIIAIIIVAVKLSRA